MNTGTTLNPRQTSYEIIWALDRTPPRNGYFELRDVFGFLGIILGAGVLLTHAPAKKFLLAWFGSIALFYLIIADTSGDGWAYYYHCISVPPAALLISLGALAIMQRLRNSNMSGLGRKWPVRVVGIVVAATLCLSLARAYFFWSKMAYGPGIPAYTCMQELARLVPPDAHIVARGGVRYDAHGHSVAYNASTPFAWMDRKGVNYATEDFSIEWLQKSEQDGERFWIAGPEDLKIPEIRKEADKRFSILGRCGDYTLYDLHTHPGTQ